MNRNQTKKLTRAEKIALLGAVLGGAVKALVARLLDMSGQH
ncbi:hypothetical protein [Streptomyces collinus]|nr:hypothetical protein [Streptomyces collinus]